MKYSDCKELIDTGNSLNEKGNLTRNTYFYRKIRLRTDGVFALRTEEGLTTEIYFNRRNPRLLYHIVCLDKALDVYGIEIFYRRGGVDSDFELVARIA